MLPIDDTDIESHFFPSVENSASTSASDNSLKLAAPGILSLSFDALVALTVLRANRAAEPGVTGEELPEEASESIGV